MSPAAWLGVILPTLVVWVLLILLLVIRGRARKDTQEASPTLGSSLSECLPAKTPVAVHGAVPRQRLSIRVDDSVNPPLLRVEGAQMSWLPTGTFAMRTDLGEGDGIVMAAGGPRYGPLGYAALKRVREYGGTLPVEWWHAGPSEKPLDEQAKLLEDLGGVKVLDLCEVTGLSPKAAQGFQAKVLAVYHSSFRRCVVMDADLVPYDNPCDLIDPLLTHLPDQGAYVFGDFVDCFVGSYLMPHHVWTDLGLAPACDERQQESALMFLDRSAPGMVSALAFAAYCAHHAKVVYKSNVLWGDKDTWRIGFRLFRVAYAMSPIPPGAVGRGPVSDPDRVMASCFLQHHPTKAARGLPDGTGWVSAPLYGNGRKRPMKHAPNVTFDGAEWNMTCDPSVKLRLFRLTEGRARPASKAITQAHEAQSRDYYAWSKLDLSTT